MKIKIRFFAVILMIFLISVLFSIPSFASSETYYRNQLTANQKAVYDALVKAMPSKGASTCIVTVDLPEPLVIVTNSFDQAFYDKYESFLLDVCEKAIDAVRLDCQYFFWEQMSHFLLPSVPVYGPPYTVEYKQVQLTIDVASAFPDVPSMTSEIKSAVKSIKASGTSLYEKVKSIHDQICNMVTYDYDAVSTIDLIAHTAYGSLIKNKAVCEGYAKAFKLVCENNGIDCVLVRGIATNSKGKSEGHMWNYVKMDDGKWYGIDCTWDDAGDKLRYKYFLFTSDIFSERTEESDKIIFPTLSKKAYDVPEEHKHSFSNWVSTSTEKHKGTCSCGETKTEAHSWNDGKITSAATCATDGEKTYTCKLCDAVKKETIEKTDKHSYGEWTEKDSESHIRTCSVCNKTSKKDHAWDNGLETTKATCDSDGVKTYTCKLCGAVKKETIEKTDKHSYGEWTEKDSESHIRTCSVCNKTSKIDHAWDNGSETTKATCTSDGVITYTCKDCKATKIESTEKLSHNFGDWVLISDSQHQRKCECGEIQIENHIWNDGTVTIEATELSSGEKVYKCSVCGEEKKEIIEKLPSSKHDPQDQDDVNTDTPDDSTRQDTSDESDEPIIPDTPDNLDDESDIHNLTKILIYSSVFLLCLIIVVIFIFSKRKR